MRFMAINKLRVAIYELALRLMRRLLRKGNGRETKRKE
jgi:hypothetical protein